MFRWPEEVDVSGEAIFLTLLTREDASAKLGIVLETIVVFMLRAILRSRDCRSIHLANIIDGIEGALPC